MPPTVKFELKLNGTDLKMEEARLLNVLYYQNIRGCAQYYITCTDLSWSYYDGLYEADAELQMRIGIEVGNKTTWSPVQHLLVGEVNASYHPDAVFVTISGMDKGEKLFRTCSRKMWNDKLISSMVTDLAGESGLNTQVETTKDKFSEAQGLLPDGHYIQKVLLPMAYSASRQDFLCYMKNGDTLVFEPPDVSSSQKTLTFPGAEDDYAALEPPHIYFRPINLAPNGALSTEMRGVDPLKKEATYFTANDSTVSLQKYASEVPEAPENPARIAYTAYAEKKILENMTKALWATRSRELWILDAKTTLSPELEIGKAVDFNMTSEDGKSHFSSGKYMLAGLLHWIDTINQENMSRLWLARRSK